MKMDRFKSKRVRSSLTVSPSAPYGSTHVFNGIPFEGNYTRQEKGTEVKLHVSNVEI